MRDARRVFFIFFVYFSGYAVACAHVFRPCLFIWAMFTARPTDERHVRLRALLHDATRYHARGRGVMPFFAHYSILLCCRFFITIFAAHEIASPWCFRRLSYYFHLLTITYFDDRWWYEEIIGIYACHHWRPSLLLLLFFFIIALFFSFFIFFRVICPCAPGEV